MRFILILALAFTLLLPAADAQTNRRAHPAQTTNPVCSTTLPDGRSFLTGASGKTTSQPWANFFSPDGQLTPAAAPLAPRTSHICVALGKDLILIAGGSSGSGGPTSSAELYTPSTNSWSTTGSMRTARTNAAAILLPDGKVLVTGGETSGQIANSLEIFDPNEGGFRLAAGVLSSPRARHAIAALPDGRVLLAGGYDGNQQLDSVDIFDPATESVRSAGFMNTRRSDLTATSLSGGRVLLAGGTDGTADLATAELFDAVTGRSESLPSMSVARKGHLAIRPPGSDSVLIGGADSETAEVFDPATGKFSAATAGTTVTLASIDANGKPRSVKSWNLPKTAAANK